ncbi:MAG: trigger factor [Candidatus Zixiibacteriota bacterium]|jgi:trigger factor
MAEFTKIGENTVRLEVEIPAEEVRAQADRTYAELARTVKMPGFRKGKTPRRILQRKYAEHVLQTVIDDLVPVAFDRAANELGIDVVDTPRYEVTAAAVDGPIEFKAEVAVFPEIELPDYSKFAVKRERHEVKDDDVDRALENMRQANARLEPVGERASLDGELVILRFIDEAPEGFSQQTVGVWASVDADDPFARQVMGKKAGDSFDLVIEYPADYPSPRHAGTKAEVPVEVSEVKKKIPPDLNDDFARDVGEDDLESLRARFRTRLEARAEQISYVAAYRRFIEDVLARAKVPMDDSFLATFIEEGESGELDEKTRQERLEEARRDLGQYFVVRELARREKIEVSADEVREAITAAASAGGAAPERPAAVYDRLLNEKLAAKLVPREPSGEDGVIVRP